jgi:BlaI family penicillinase repressor
MATRDCKLTEAEWEIIQVVWEQEPCAAPTVQEELEAHKKWTYSTVKTLMDRMVTKGLLTTERIRNLILYRSAVTQKQARRGEVMKTLTRAFGGAFTPMMQFMLESHALSTKELSELEGMIQKKRRRGKEQAGK